MYEEVSHVWVTAICNFVRNCTFQNCVFLLWKLFLYIWRFFEPFLFVWLFCGGFCLDGTTGQQNVHNSSMSTPHLSTAVPHSHVSVLLSRYYLLPSRVIWVLSMKRSSYDPSLHPWNCWNFVPTLPFGRHLLEHWDIHHHYAAQSMRGWCTALV